MAPLTVCCLDQDDCVGVINQDQCVGFKSRPAVVTKARMSFKLWLRGKERELEKSYIGPNYFF